MIWQKKSKDKMKKIQRGLWPCDRAALFRAALIAGVQSPVKTHHGLMRKRVGSESV